jgi:hypothetical protein
MTPRLSRQLYQEALEATGEGGMIRIYPVCRGCERRGWSVGKGTERSTLNSVDYFII